MKLKLLALAPAMSAMYSMQHLAATRFTGDPPTANTGICKISDGTGELGGGVAKKEVFGSAGSSAMVDSIIYSGHSDGAPIGSGASIISKRDAGLRIT